MAIDAYIQKNDLDVEVRFDIISYLVENGKWNREHIENAFYPF
jgi:putative endonuclease